MVATGGLSIPKLGATGLGYDLARQFGLRIVEPRPALVPLVLGGNEFGWTKLAGVSTEVLAWAEAAAGKKSDSIQFREKMLVTHRGLSGPAVLQASLYWQPGDRLVVNFRGLTAQMHPRFCRSGWLTILLRSADRRAGRMRPWRPASGDCTDGSFIRPGRRDLKRPR